jgi:glycerol-3-phosphate dehydrogenase (NAD(P)+)
LGAEGDGNLEERTEKVTIIGDGQMGLVMADALALQGVSVRLWGPFAADIERLAASRRSDRLRDLALDPKVHVVADEQTALRDATLVFSAIPSQFLRAVWKRLARSFSRAEALSIVSVTKGIENDTLMRPTQIIRETLAEEGGATCVTGVLSGPTIAAELAKRLPASLVAASDDPELAQRVQAILQVPWLRVYRHDDVVGVEIAGAAKNVIALAAGIVDGLGLGANAKSALLARGLSEIARLLCCFPSPSWFFSGSPQPPRSPLTPPCIA